MRWLEQRRRLRYERAEQRMQRESGTWRIVLYPTDDEEINAEGNRAYCPHVGVYLAPPLHVPQRILCSRPDGHEGNHEFLPSWYLAGGWEEAVTSSPK